MRVTILTVSIAAFCVGFTSTRYYADEIDIRVIVDAETPPNQVTLNAEGAYRPDVLTRSQSDGAYNITIPIPSSKANSGSSQLPIPYLRVASFDNNMNNKKEQLYLRFSPVTPRKLQLNIYHRYYECDHRGLSKIEMLGNDFDSTLEKYFRARNLSQGMEVRKAAGQACGCDS